MTELLTPAVEEIPKLEDMNLPSSSALTLDSSDTLKEQIRKIRQNKANKKSSEIWDHYRLMAEAQNVECVHCWRILRRNDSSTKSMWGHMTAYHQDQLDESNSRKKRRILPTIEKKSDDGVIGEKVEHFFNFKEVYFQTPTQPYVKRARAGGLNHQTQSATDSMALALQQLQNASNVGFAFVVFAPSVHQRTRGLFLSFVISVYVFPFGRVKGHPGGNTFDESLTSP